MYETVLNLLSGFGLPAICFFLAWYEMREQRKEYTNLLQTEQVKHETESKELTQAINNNTVVMERILEKLRLDEATA